MPANKKHHYVPRFYLKRFASDERSVNLYNFKLARAIVAANLKNQCYRDYMYGKDGKFEMQLSQLEGVAAQMLQHICLTCELPIPMSAAHANLGILTILQYARTAYSADALDEMADGMWKAVLSKDPTVSPDMLDKVRIVNTDPANRSISLMLPMYPLLLDLECRLLIATPGTEFITSDSPVVLYNQLMEFESLTGSTGLANKGLQIFFPLSPQHMLCFFDSAVYAYEPRKKTCFFVPNRQDMQQLNALQVISAFENVYYASPGADVFKAVDLGAHYRRVRKVKIIKGPELKTPTGGSQLIGTSRESIRNNLSLSFIRILKPAKRWREERKKPGLKPVSVVRNPGLVRAHDEFMELVDKGAYQPAEFARFLAEIR